MTAGRGLRRRRLPSRAVPMVLAVVTAIMSLATVGPVTAQEASVAEMYGAPGPHEVVVSDVTDAEGATALLFRPADLEAGPYPALVWGNGSAATPADYQALLEHFASWGFVVIATTHDQVGTGEEMRATLDHLEAMAADRDDVLFGAVDLDAVGVTGHSQGAGGSTRSAQLDDRFAALATVALPNEAFVSPGDEYVVDELTVPTLFLGGTLDPISPNTVNRDFFDRVPGAAAVAMLTTASHNDVQPDGAAFRPYLTAWFRYLLAGDAAAARAFLGDAPELAADGQFNGQAFKSLPAPEARRPRSVSPGATPPTTRASDPEPTPVTTPTAPAVPWDIAPAPDAIPAILPADQVALPPTPAPSAALAPPVGDVADEIDAPALAVAVVVLGGAVAALAPRRRRRRTT